MVARCSLFVRTVRVKKKLPVSDRHHDCHRHAPLVAINAMQRRTSSNAMHPRTPSRAQGAASLPVRARTHHAGEVAHRAR